MGKTLIAAFDGGNARSPDEGGTWKSSATPVTGGYPYLDGIVTAGSQVLAKGFKGGLWRSSDTGATWNALSAAPFAASAFNMASNGKTLLVVGNSQVFVSSDNGTSWVRFEDGLPNGTVRTGVGATENFLFIITGNGMWRRPVAEVPAGIVGRPASRQDPGFVKTGRPGQVAFYLPKRGLVRLDVLDVRGMPVATGLHSTLPGGLHEYTLAADLPRGVYWARLSVSGTMAYSRVTLISR
jgi:hypothetical protein